MDQKLVARLAAQSPDLWRSVCSQMAWTFRQPYSLQMIHPKLVRMGIPKEMTVHEWSEVRAEVGKRRRKAQYQAKALRERQKKVHRKEYMRRYMQRWRAKNSRAGLDK